MRNLSKLASVRAGPRRHRCKQTAGEFGYFQVVLRIPNKSEVNSNAFNFLLVGVRIWPMRCSLRSSKICLRPRSRRQSPHKNFAGVGCVGKNFGTQRRVGSHCGRVGKLEAPCRLKKKSNPHLKESVIKSAPTSVGEPNARAHSLTQSRPSQQNCYGPQGT